MGGRPIIALNVVCFPTDCEPLDVLEDILKGGAGKVCEAGAMLAGGHSVQDKEPKYGLVVFGEADKDSIWTVGTAQDGDALVLTKPVGTGIAVTAIKAGLFPDINIETAVESMSRLNSVPPVLSEKTRMAIHACTDLTGFGLAGHVLDLPAEGVSVEIDMSALPILPGVREMSDMGLIPAGSYRNKEYLGHKVINGSKMGQFADDIVFDPQTSGGLLMSIPEKHAAELISELKKGGFSSSVMIGHFVKGNGTLKMI